MVICRVGLLTMNQRIYSYWQMNLYNKSVALILFSAMWAVGMDCFLPSVLTSQGGSNVRQTNENGRNKNLTWADCFKDWPGKQLMWHIASTLLSSCTHNCENRPESIEVKVMEVVEFSLSLSAYRWRRKWETLAAAWSALSRVGLKFRVLQATARVSRLHRQQ